MKKVINIYLILVFSISISRAINVGDTAPDFTLQSLDNGEISLSDYSGKVVYLYFLGNQCPFCITDGPVIESQINQYYQDNVQVIGIDMWSGGADPLRNYKNSTGITFPLLIGGGSMSASLYQLTRQHVTIIVDQHGKIADIHDNYPNNLDIAGSRSVIDELLSITDILDQPHPYKFELKSSYPNPFNPSTHISFSVDNTQAIKLQIFDISGKLVKTLINETMSAGIYEAYWNGTNVNGNNAASGLYFVTLTGKSLHSAKQIILLK